MFLNDQVHQMIEERCRY